MILDAVPVKQLAEALAPHMAAPAWPGLEDPAIRARARDHARASGLWERIAAELRPDEPIPALRHADYLAYARRGDRRPWDEARARRRQRTHLAALALWLDHPAASLDHLQDLLWAWCESTWVPPAHAGHRVDLVSTETALILAEYGWLFRDRLDAGVRERIDREIAARILDPACDWRRSEDWATKGSNWNPVCNGNLIQIALYQIRDHGELAAAIHPWCRRLDYAVAAFTPDGGCEEGPAYWEYGFGHLLDAVLTLRHRTGGAIMLIDDEHVRRICRFGLATQLRGPQRATFGDCRNGHLAAKTAFKIARLYGIAEPLRLVEALPSGDLRMEDIRTLALDDGRRPDGIIDRDDHVLPDLGFAKVHAAAADVLICATAGNNGVPHNHNDIGSFMLMAGSSVLLTDAGSPVYDHRTFSPRRYELLFCRSRGHSLPVINGREQPAGSAYRGTLALLGPDARGAKTVRMDLSRAYDDPTLISLVRELVLAPDGGLEVVDSYRFSSAPTAVEEAFVTFEAVAIAADGGKAAIGGGALRAVLRACTPGRFALESFPPAVHAGQDPRVLNRIRFVPDRLEAEMRLAVTCAPAPGGR